MPIRSTTVRGQVGSAISGGNSFTISSSSVGITIGVAGGVGASTVAPAMVGAVTASSGSVTTITATNAVSTAAITPDSSHTTTVYSGTFPGQQINIRNRFDHSAFVSEGALFRQTRTSSPQSSPTQLDLSSLIRYEELAWALSEMHNAEDESWKIEDSVYASSMQVAAALMEWKIPNPSVFAHGPKSVVFSWSYAQDNLYLTISSRRLFVLVSSPEKIKYRTEIAGPQVSHTDRFLSALSSAQIHASPEPLSAAPESKQF
jgi:hypothetical protein